MLFSIFTPTHNPAHLDAIYASLKTHQEPWEWIIVPNGAAAGYQFPGGDPRVRVCPIPDDYPGVPGIGRLKKFACSMAQGDVLVELDHDDFLVPDVLGDIGYGVEHGAGFIYSDAALFTEGESGIKAPGPDKLFDETFGWETYEVNVFGHDLWASRNFDITPRSLCEIMYAPDHVRAWTREAYDKAGGHDANLAVCDDHDLICRTYIAGVPFHYTGGCGYLYRVHKGQASSRYNAMIQHRQAANRDKYLYKLVREWRHREKHLYLDLQQRPWKVLPRTQMPHIQAPTSSVGVIGAYGCFLHRYSSAFVLELLNECYRVLVPGGFLSINFASTDGPGGFSPDALSYWNTWSIDWLTQVEHHVQLKPDFKARFQKVRCYTKFPNDYCREQRLPHVYADLCAIKGQRQPGRVYV